MMTTSFMVENLLGQHTIQNERGLKPATTVRSSVSCSRGLQPALLFWKLPEIEVHFDIQRDINGYAIPHAGPEAPLLERLDGVFIEAEPEAAHDALDIDCTVSANNRFEDDRSLITGFAGFLGILWLNTLDHGRRGNTAANMEYATACTATFAGAYTGAFTFTDTSALPASNAATNAWACRRRAGNTVRITDIQ